jgi:hypothetical protein
VYHGTFLPPHIYPDIKSLNPSTSTQLHPGVTSPLRLLLVDLASNTLYWGYDATGSEKHRSPDLDPPSGLQGPTKNVHVRQLRHVSWTATDTLVRTATFFWGLVVGSSYVPNEALFEGT